MGRQQLKSLSSYFTLGAYACVYLALAGQSSCSGTGTKTFGNSPGSNSSTSSGTSNAAGAASFDGLVSATPIDSTSSTIVYGNSQGAASINVYCKIGVSSATVVLVRSISNIVSTGGSFVLNNLSSGVTFSCYGLAVNAAGVETANLTPVSVSFQTLSVLQTAYRNVVTVSAFGDTTNPTAQPSSRMADISWRPFSGAAITTSTAYSVYRTPKNTYPTFPDAIASCVSSTISGTCKVTCRAGSNLTGTSNLRCIDTDVAVSPAQYWYFISPLSSTTVAVGAPLSKPEEYPALPGQVAIDPLYPKVSSTITPTQDAYLTTVPIPPSEMALVHRESVNFEFCNLVGRASDLDTFSSSNGVGHLFKNRCVYNGLGARPTNTNSGGASITIPGVAQGINTYDFGYNLFVDRVEAGCNWTTAANGGMCGPLGTAGDCVGNVTQTVGNFVAGGIIPNNLYGAILKPSDSIGQNGNVFQAFNGYNHSGSNTGDFPFVGPSCYIKINNSWTIASSALLFSYPALQSSAPVHNLTTANSSRVLPPLLVDQGSAAVSCNSQTMAAAGYPGGKKRLLRRREFVAASAWPTLQGEPNKLLPTQIGQLRSSHSAGNTATSGISTDVDFSRSGCFQPNYLGGTRYQFYSGANSVASTSIWGTGAASWWKNNVITDLFPNLNDLVSSQFGFFMGVSLYNGYIGGSNTPNGGATGPGVMAVGSYWSRNCVSRFGIQDLLGNVPEWNSEEMTCDTSGCSAITSQFDDGASLYGYTMTDGSSGPVAKDPLWFVGSDMGYRGYNVPGFDPYNVKNGWVGYSAGSGIATQPATRSTVTGTNWLQSQFQVYSMGPTQNAVPTPGPVLSLGSQSHIRHFYPALGLPAAAVGVGTLDYTDPTLSVHTLGVTSFHIMNGASRVGLISGSATSSALAFKPSGSADTALNGGYVIDSLVSHANRWTPLFESGNRVTGNMHWPQPPKGFRCAFSPD